MKVDSGVTSIRFVLFDVISFWVPWPKFPTRMLQNAERNNRPGKRGIHRATRVVGNFLIQEAGE